MKKFKLVGACEKNTFFDDTALKDSLFIIIVLRWLGVTNLPIISKFVIFTMSLDTFKYSI